MTPRWPSSACASTASPPTPSRSPGPARRRRSRRPPIRCARRSRRAAANVRAVAAAQIGEPAALDARRRPADRGRRGGGRIGRDLRAGGPRSLPVERRHGRRPGPGRRRRPGRRRLSARGRDRRAGARVLAAAAIAGADEVYAVGGAQAIAALAHGTGSIPAVDVIAGPGSPWVQEAKLQCSRRVGIDGYAGPSELVVIATANGIREWIALDLCAQAEHGADGMLVAIATDAALLRIWPRRSRRSARRRRRRLDPRADRCAGDVERRLRARRGAGSRAPRGDRRRAPASSPPRDDSRAASSRPARRRPPSATTRPAPTTCCRPGRRPLRRPARARGTFRRRISRGRDRGRGLGARWLRPCDRRARGFRARRVGEGPGGRPARGQ